jgi:hypothetical protein
MLICLLSLLMTCNLHTLSMDSRCLFPASVAILSDGAEVGSESRPSTRSPSLVSWRHSSGRFWPKSWSTAVGANVDFVSSRVFLLAGMSGCGSWNGLRKRAVGRLVRFLVRVKRGGFEDIGSDEAVTHVKEEKMRGGSP